MDGALGFAVRRIGGWDRDCCCGSLAVDELAELALEEFLGSFGVVSASFAVYGELEGLDGGEGGIFGDAFCGNGNGAENSASLVE